MLPSERVVSAMSRNAMPDRVPFEISWGAFTPRLMKIYREKTGSNLEPDEYVDFDTRYVRLLPTERIVDHRKAFPGTDFPDDVAFDDWGIGMVPTDCEIPDFKFHPLEKATCVMHIESFN